MLDLLGAAARLESLQSTLVDSKQVLTSPALLVFMLKRAEVGLMRLCQQNLVLVHKLFNVTLVSNSQELAERQRLLVCKISDTADSSRKGSKKSNQLLQDQASRDTTQRHWPQKCSEA